MEFIPLHLASDQIAAHLKEAILHAHRPDLKYANATVIDILTCIHPLE